MHYTLILPTNIAKSVQRPHRWITRNKRKQNVSDKELARRKYRRQLVRVVDKIKRDPFKYEDEAFNVKTFTERDVW